MEKVFGIDLGTTYSCVAYIDENNKPVVLKNAEGELTTPSVVFFESKEDVTVGSSAKESLKMYPDQTVSFIKRDMGQANLNRIINGVSLSPEEISSYVLKKCVKDAEDTLRQEGKLGENESVKNVVITCPAYFGINERTATQNAGEIAGLNVLQIINEPTAAAITYGIIDDSVEKTVLVYDLGGGTFDVTIIHIKPGEIKVICTGGDHNLGGKDWDDKILLYLDDEYREQTGQSDSVLDDPEMLQELVLSVEKAKKLLTSKEKAPISFNYNGNKVRIELTRDKFDELTSDLLNRTIDLTKDIFNESAKKGYKESDIDEILLVGGSSKMPQVAKKVREMFSVEPKMFDPDEAVAKGAAIYAAKQNNYNIILEEAAAATGKTVEELKVDLNKGSVDIKDLAEKTNVSDEVKMFLGSSNEINIVNVTSRSFGTLAFLSPTDKEKKLYNMILRNTELPVTVTDKFCPMNDNQRDVQIDVLESLTTEKIADKDMGNNIGTVKLELPEGTKKTSIIELKFTLNESGLLELHAVDKTSGKEVSAKFETTNALTDEEKQHAITRMVDSEVN